MSPYCRWRTEGLVGGDGVIIGCTQILERHLPWWWINYRLHNDNPVTFFDFGMSPPAKEWCKKKGPSSQ